MNNELKNMSVRKLLPFLLLLALVISGYLFRGDIAYFLADYLVINYRLGQAGAIAVLGGASPKRVMEAVDIYKEGYGERIIITRQRRPEGKDVLESRGIRFNEEYANNYNIALEMGVDRKKIIILEPTIEDTLDEIETIHNFLREEGIGSVILVTSKYHSIRTSVISGHVFDDATEFMIRTSRNGSFDPETVLKVPLHREIVFLEYHKLIYYYIQRFW